MAIQKNLVSKNLAEHFVDSYLNRIQTIANDTGKAISEVYDILSNVKDYAELVENHSDFNDRKIISEIIKRGLPGYDDAKITKGTELFIAQSPSEFSLQVHHALRARTLHGK